MPGEVRPKPRSILLYHQSGLLRPREDRPKARSCCLYQHQDSSELYRAGRIDHSSSAIKSSVIASPGALSTSSLGRVLGLEALEGGESTPHSIEGYSGGYLKPSVCSEWFK